MAIPCHSIESVACDHILPGGPVPLIGVYLIYKRIKPIITPGCYKKLTFFLFGGFWLTYAQFVAVEKLPVGSTGSLYHASWMISMMAVARSVNHIYIYKTDKGAF